MKILLGWPNRAAFGFKSIGVALLAGALKSDGHDVRLFDATPIDLGDAEKVPVERTRIRIFKPVDTSGLDLEKRRLDLRSEVARVLEDFRPDVVGISALSDEERVGVAISNVAKEWNPHVPVVWGNKAATMAPDRILAHPSVDYACIGEGFEFFPEFAAAAAAGADIKRLKNLAWRDEQGVTRRNPLRPFYEDLDSLPYVDWSLFDRRHFVKPYDGQLYVGGDQMIAWGCPYSCTYCINDSYRALYRDAGGRYLRRYSVDRIIAELRQLVSQWGVTFFKFHDEDFRLKPMDYFRALSHAYRDEVGVPFTAMANARNVTPEKVRLLSEMGCVSVSIGIESGDEHIRRGILRRKETQEEIVRAVHLLAGAGVRTAGFNMIGVPHETRETVMETVRLNRDSGVDCADTGFFYPLIGTELYDVAVSEGLFDPSEDQGCDDVHPNLSLPGITTDELIALRERFALLAKLPEEYAPYILRSEANDAIGHRLFGELLRIYETAVLEHRDTFDPDRPVAHDLELLSRIVGGSPQCAGFAA